MFDTSYRIAGDYDLFVRLLEVGRVSYHHIPTPLAVFDRSGFSSDPRYRWSLKAWRQEWQDFFYR